MTNSQSTKVGLLLSMLCFTAAVLIAQRNPATSYEPSIYTNTPLLFWVFLSISVLIAVVIVVNGIQPIWRYFATGIIAGSMLVIVLLPVIREYWLIGSGDPMTVLGYLRDIHQGGNAFEELYPAMLVMPLILHEVLGSSLNNSMIITPTIFSSLFIISIPILIRRLGFRRQTVIVAVIFSSLLLPINLVATHLIFHANSMTVFFSGFVMFALFLLIEEDGLWPRISLLLILTAAVLFHPQQALSLIAVVVTIGLVQIVFYQVKTAPSPQSRPMLTLGAASGGVWMLWLFVQEGFESHIAWTIIGFLEADSASPTAGRAGTFNELGISLIELVLRLFALDIIFLFFVGAATLFVAAWFFNQIGVVNTKFTPKSWSRNQSLIGVGLVTALFPVLIIFGFFLASGVSQQFMRIIGFLMMLGTILAVFAFDELYTRMSEYSNNFTFRQLAVVFLMGLLVLSGLTVHSSEFTYRESFHVTETSVEGYETAFEYHDESVDMVDLRRLVWRYVTALEGEQGDPMVKYTGELKDNPPPDHFADQSLTSHYDSDKQLVVTEADRYLEAELYNGLRQSEDDFEYLERQPGINRQYDNGEVQWYYIRANHSNDAS